MCSQILLLWFSDNTKPLRQWEATPKLLTTAWVTGCPDLTVYIWQNFTLSLILQQKDPKSNSQPLKGARGTIVVPIFPIQRHTERDTDSPSLSKANAYRLFFKSVKEKDIPINFQTADQSLCMLHISYKLTNRKSCTFQVMKLQKQKQLMKEPSTKKSTENLNSTCIS